jgi:hypothetical protein
VAARTASCNCGQLSVTYEGPEPERRSLCQCYRCQKRTGSVLSVQARIPREQVTIEGRSSTWAFPVEGEDYPFLACDTSGAVYHFCPVCGSTVYWDIEIAPDVIGVAVGAFADPTFPAPMISGFEAYGHSWAMNAEGLPIPHHPYDGISLDGTRHDQPPHSVPAEHGS